MRLKASSLGMAVIAPIGAVTIACSGTSPLPLPVVATPAQLLAQSLYMRGTKIGSYTDDDKPFVDFANGVVGATYGAGATLVEDPGGDDGWMTGHQVEYNGGFWPVSKGGLNDLTYGASVDQGLDRLGQRIDATPVDPTGPIVVVGYSQSAVILSRYKADTGRKDIIYVLVSNPTRPNGGILARFPGITIPILDVPFSGPAPTTSHDWNEGEPPTTFDVAQQYDGWADFPVYPLNVVASANAVLGIVYLHGKYEDNVAAKDLGADAANTDSHTTGDTVYYTVGTDLLPLLRPLEQIGVPKPVLVALDAPLRVLVEQGYDRTIKPGEPTSARLIRIANPVTDLTNFVHAIPVGIDDGLEAAGYDRVFRTEKAGMYGVGGPQVTKPTDHSPGDQTTAQKNSPQPSESVASDPSPQRLTSPESEPAQAQEPKEDQAAGETSRTETPERRKAEGPRSRIKPDRTITRTLRTIAGPRKPAIDIPENAESVASTDESTTTGKTKTAKSRGKSPKHEAPAAGGTTTAGPSAETPGGDSYSGKHRKTD